MVAFKASKLVCCAMEVMTLMTMPISALDWPNLATVVLAACAVVTAVEATLAASLALAAML